jgi:phosphoserine phosphatase
VIVISDMMGTLTTGSPVLGMLDWVRHNQSRLQADLRFLAITPGYLLAKAHLLDWQKWGQALMVDSLGWVHQATPEKFAAAAEWTVAHNLWPKRRPDVIARLQAHASQGAQVYLASSVIEPVAAAFAARFGAQAIGSRVEYHNRRVRLAGELVASERKIEEVLTRLGVTRVDFAYGDTALDVPLLEHADHPVAVYPDPALRAIAQQRGWEIIGEGTSYP